MVNEKCHVFTPAHIVNKMLDEVNYTEKLYGKTFLENSCGDGQILCEAINRYIIDCKNEGYSDENIILGLERDFLAIEFDKANYEKCIENLDALSKSYGFKSVNWNILNSDFLSLEIHEKFDFIIGNPPYVSYANIDFENRNFIRDNFESCKKGKFDYCYPFIELSLRYLNTGGKLVYLIPTNIFKNVFAKDLRELLKDKVTKILDYKTTKIFKNVLTSSSIIICDLDKYKTSIDYYDVSNNKYASIEKESLGEKWIFSENKEKDKVLFSDYFLAATSVATLLNEAFVIKECKIYSDYFYVENMPIEKGIIRPAASPRSLSKEIQEFIIFPYEYVDGKLKRLEIEDMFNRYPYALKYLEKFKEKLNLRDSDANSKWFEYGRSQALDNLNQEKLLMSFIVTNKVNVYELGVNDIPYSGIYIVPKADLNLSVAKEILESDEFLKYVNDIGIYVSGSSLRITANDIKKFDISKWRKK
ncbi:Eco57I restriction-modification methylase domain-containing protein [Enterococcus cecorum]|uniref:Eco57I restriction-modification methylase domain-containing protein n=1 Tax=Enterococcus cecorum TaxID=44008 RepID=UPI003266B713